MISTELARALRDSGLVWKPRAGDAFRIDLVEADDELFVLSDMTVEAARGARTGLRVANRHRRLHGYGRD